MSFDDTRTRVVARYLESKLTSPFDAQRILAIKSDLETFVSNFPRVKTQEDLNALTRAANSWANKLQRDYKSLMLYLRDNLDKPYTSYLKSVKPLFDAFTYVSPPFDLEAWENVKWDWREKLQKVIAELPSVIKWLQKQKLTPEISQTPQRNMSIAGYPATLTGFDPDDPTHMKGLQLLEESLKQFVRRAAKVLPEMVRHKFPLDVRFDVEDILGSAGQYGDGVIHIYPLNIGRVATMVHTLAHEVAHYIGLDFLPQNARAFWIQAIKGDLGSLDLRDVLKAWPSGKSSMAWEADLKLEDPILYLQVQTLHDSRAKALPKELEEDWSRESIAAFLDRGGKPTVAVPKTPISGYAATNPNEAFAEAVSYIIAFGPRAVHPTIRSWLQIILPEGNFG